MKMKKGLALFGFVVLVATAALAAALAGHGPSSASASSHREAPLISDDPTADSTDLYAFVSPDAPDTVTIVANYIPFEDPAGGPNYYKLDPTASYEIKIDNDGDGEEDVTYDFRFKTTVVNPNTFLYNTGPIDPVTYENLNVKQTYTVTRSTGKGKGKGKGKKTVLVSDAPVAPANIGPRSNPTYDPYGAVQDLGDGRKVFVGPRDDPFFVDLGSIFDLGGLRPFNPFHLIPLAAAAGVDGVRNYNVHTLALQVPKTDLVKAPMLDGTIGIYTSASRPKVRIFRDNGTIDADGPMVQVSRLGNPLVNEVIIPLGKKDLWNASDPEDDEDFAGYYTTPELTGLVNLLYLPPVKDAPTTGREDLVAVLLTGVPGLNYTGTTKADLLRLNTAIPPAASPNKLGALATPTPDFQGFPNGRRLADDVTDIELRAVACGYGAALGAAPPAGLGLCNLSPNNIVGDGVDTNEQAFLPHFPYVAAPNQGYAHTGHN